MTDQHQHIAAAFDRDLEAIQASVMKMGGLVEENIRQGAKALKIKLGTPDGIEADKAMYQAVLDATEARPDIVLRVDAGHTSGWIPRVSPST